VYLATQLIRKGKTQMKPAKDVLNDEDYIQEGANPAHGVLILGCTVGDDYDDPQNHILLLKNDTWMDFTYEGEPVVSLDAAPDGGAYVLSESGEVVQFNWQSPATQAQLEASRKLLANKTADALGPLRTIRVLGNVVFCGGSRGQAYRLKGSRFDALPRLSAGDEELTIEDLSGTGFNDLMAVTTDGYAAHFDGSAWHVLDLPSSSGLNRICRLSDGKYAITGYNGTALIGAGDQWQLIPPIDDARNYFGVASWGTDVFFSYLGGIDVFDGVDFRPLKIPKASKLEFAILRSGADGVWSLAGQTIGKVTATGWTAFR
jgi:hypothetical protein